MAFCYFGLHMRSTSLLSLGSAGCWRCSSGSIFVNAFGTGQWSCLDLRGCILRSRGLSCVCIDAVHSIADIDVVLMQVGLCVGALMPIRGSPQGIGRIKELRIHIGIRDRGTPAG